MTNNPSGCGAAEEFLVPSDEFADTQHMHGKYGHAHQARTVDPRLIKSTVVVVVLAVVHALVVSTLSIIHHRNFGTYAFDFGIYDQAWWLAGQNGRGFDTVRGLPVYGHHTNFVLILLAPFARLGLGAWFLILFQSVSLAAGAIPVSWIAKQRTDSALMGIGAAVIYLLYPPITWMSALPFHPESLSVAPMLFAIWFAMNSRWTPFWICVVLALSTREEVGLTVAVLGLIMMFRNRPRRIGSDRPSGRARVVTFRMGVLTTLVGMGWFALAIGVLIPRSLNGEGAFYVSFFAQYGDSMGEVVSHLLTHPNEVVAAATQPDALQFQLDLFGPLGFLPVLGLPMALMAAPELAITLLGSENFLRVIVGQYTAFMVPGLIVGTIDVVARVKRRSSPKRPMFKVVVAWLCFCSLFGAYARTPLPGSMAFRYWKLQQPRNASALHEALALIPKDASVTASADLVTHLSHRRHIYVYPNPLVREKYGLEARPPYTTSPYVPVEPTWVILNGDRWDSDATTIELRANRRWVVAFEKDEVTVFRSAAE